MKLRKLLAGGVVYALACCTVPVMAQNDAPVQDDRMAEMMEAWMKLASPGPHHAHLRPMAGTWKQEMRWRMDPAMPEMTSTCEAKSEWILGDRFLMSTVKGPPMMGMPTPFEGFGIMGYDNGTRKYTHIWLDNMGTMMMTSEGTCSEDGKTVTLVGSYDDPMSGSKKTLKTVYVIENDDRFRIEMFDKTPDGGEFMSMQIISTRSGPAKPADD